VTKGEQAASWVLVSVLYLCGTLTWDYSNHIEQLSFCLLHSHNYPRAPLSL
jgi:hypothetical protein